MLERKIDTMVTKPPAASAARIAADLKLAIQQGVYAHNERLPAERQLADQFGASRGTVREALRRLEDTNLVVRRVGSGTFVKYRNRHDQSEIAKATSPVELIEVRFGIEPQMVRLAVINASGHDLEKLEIALTRVCAAHDAETFSEADTEFHLALADCTRNPLMQWLYRHLNDVRSHRQWNAMKDKILDRDRIAGYNAQHRALFEAISTRNVDDAEHAIRVHLATARAHLLGADDEREDAT